MGKWIVAVTVFLLLLTPVQAAAQAEATPNTSVTGTVLMPDGSPAKGATVEVRNLWWDHRPIAVVKTDESGAFKASPPAGKYFLHASLDTLVAEDRRTAVEVKAGGTPAGPYELKLEKGCVVSGIVTEKATGKPMEGVQVITDEGDIAVTSASGGYSFVLPKKSHRISALKDGFHRPVLNISATGERMDVSIELKPGGTIKGKVTDKEGNPIAGARVGLSVYSFYFQYTKANEAGEYVLVGFDRDTSPEISARADGFESVYDTKVGFAPGEREATLDFRLAPVQKRNVTGRVTTKDGKPVAGASVTYGMGSNYWDTKTATTGADGKYAMEVISHGKNIVMAQAKGCAPSFGIVPENIDAVVDLVVEPGHYAEGQVEDEDGKFLRANISVSVESEMFEQENMIGGDNSYSTIQRVDTDEKGHFRLEDLPREGVVIQAYAGEEGYASIDGMPLEVDRDDHIIVMYRTGKVSGKVLSAEDGLPIRKFTVVSEGGNTGTFESPDGTFTLKPYDMIPGNKITVGVEAPGYQRETEYQVEAKAEADYGTVFELKPAPDFQGIVTDEEGGPLEGVLVTIADISSRYTGLWYESEKPTARTNAEGRFKIASVPMDAGGVSLEKAGHGTVAMPGVILEKPLAVTMQKAAVITGKVLDESGKPVPDSYVAVYQKSWSWVGRQESDDKGTFRFENLQPGRYMVEATYGGRVRRVDVAEVKSGEAYEVDWNKPGQAELEGKVTRNGQPVAEVSLTLHEGDDRWWSALGRTDENGTYRIVVPKATRHRASYHAKKYEEGHGDLETTIKPGKNHLDIELPGASMSGKVFDQSTGKPITNTDVALYTKMTSQEVWSGRKWHNQDVNPWFNSVGQAKTDDKGRFTFQNLVPGECLVSMELDQHGVPGQTIALGKDEQKTGVIVRIPPTGQAHVKVVDDSTGKPLEDPQYIFCVNEQGFRFSVAYEQSGPARRPTYKMVRTPEGKLVFPSLPPGKYSIWVYSETHLPIPVTFKVMADETTDVTLRMKKSERIIFRLVGDHLPREILRLGYRITTQDGKPALTGYWGPTLGNDTFFNEKLEACMPVKPGTYQLQAALLTDESDHEIGSKDNLWSTEQTVRVEPEKDTIIEVEAK